jgi:hypothetical protein
MTRKIKWGFREEKPNQRRAHQSIHLAIAAKYFSIFSGYWYPGKWNIF